MNENPEGTPNPLNPNPRPMGGPRVTNSPGTTNNPGVARNPRPVITTPPQPRPNPTPQPQPVSQLQPVVEPQPVVETQPVVNPDPLDRPMEKAPEQPAEPKKKKTGLIVAVLIYLLIAIGCGVAAILLNLNLGGDPVAKAISRLMSGNTSNLLVNGDVDIQFGDPSAMVSKASVDFNAKLVANSMINSLDAAVKVTPQNSSKDLAFNVSETYSESGDLYLKVDGITNVLEDFLSNDGSLTTEPVIEIELEEGEEVEVVGIETDDIDEDVDDVDADTTEDINDVFMDLAESLDGEWIRLSAEDVKSFTGNTVENNALSCIMDLAKNVNANSNSAAEIYNRNPFVTSSTENMRVTSRRDPIYKLGVDSEKFTNYLNAIQNTELLNNLYTCLDWNNNLMVTTEDVAEIVETMPEIYVEINNDYVFTRLYLYYEVAGTEVDCDTSINIEEESYIDCDPSLNTKPTVMTVDLTFDYPTDINISEPVEYKNFSEIMQEFAPEEQL